MMNVRTGLTVFSIAIIIVACGCGKDSSQTGSASQPKKSVEKSVFINDTKMTLSILKGKFSQSEIIPLRLRLTNTSDQKITLHFPSSQKFDFSVKDKDGNEIWRWSANKSYAMSLTTLEIKPGEHQDFFAKIEAGVLKSGSYSVEGTSSADELFNETLSIDITVG